MNQTTTDTQPMSDLEALCLKLEEEVKVYCVNQNPQEAHDRLLHTLRTNDCREIITAVVDGGDLAGVFVRAGARGHVDILEVFLNHGMNIGIKDKDGWTALMYASNNEQEECIRFLLDHNANADVQDKSGFTALMQASLNESIKTVEMLMEKNANLDIQDESGWTALMFGSAQGNNEIVQLLLNHNADIELKDNNGKTALDRADGKKIKEMIRNHVTTSYLLK